MMIVVTITNVIHRLVFVRHSVPKIKLCLYEVVVQVQDKEETIMMVMEQPQELHQQQRQVEQLHHQLLLLLLLLR